MDFFQKSNLFLSLFFKAIMSEKIILDILDRKQSIQDQKIKVLTRAKK